jgi:ribosomal protein S1
LEDGERPEVPPEEDMSIMDQVPEPTPGAILHGKVVRVEPDLALVDVGYKSEGIVPLSELTYRHVASAEEVVKVGDEFDVLVLSVGQGEDATLRLSKRRADEVKSWDRLEEAFHTGAVLEVPVVEAVKGGLVADVGTRGFIPASQVDRGYVEDLQQYVGQTVRAKIIELDAHKRRVILSRRQVLEEERRQMKEATWQTIKEGDILEGTVKSLTDFGAFIDLGGVDGLLHISEMSWGRIHHPSEVLHEGERVKVQVLRLDRERERISLGMKQVLANPWDTAAERYPEGAIVTGTVVRLATFGAFVELEPGIDGLIHISHLADYHVARPQDVVQIGQQVNVKILKVDPVARRISLSLKEAEGLQPTTGSGGPGGAATIGDILGDDLRKDFFS